MSKKALMVTLGHNSSALYFDGYSKPIGYEEERLNNVKSSSAFPAKSISKIITKLPTDELRGATLMISHWFDVFDLKDFPAKYFDHQFVMDLVEAYEMDVELLSSDFTHHDAHMMSSKAFFEYHSEGFCDDMHYIVADGFGNNQEVLSIYKQREGSEMPRLIGRLNGYFASLGLMYQYATSFCGMKMNQDEYKFLGYEAQVLSILSDYQIEVIDEASDEFADEYLKYYTGVGTQYEINDDDNSWLNVPALAYCEAKYHVLYASVLEAINETSCGGSDLERIVVGYYIQSCIEKSMVGIVKELGIKNVCLSGGCFYNVKLNNAILKEVSGVVSVMPLAGDQGAGIGMYHHFTGLGFNFGDLCYGVRDLSNWQVNNNVKYFTDRDKFISETVEVLERGDIVNIVAGDMEFGPRALCNTTTLALPLGENIDYINMVNKRNTVMPAAPVMLESVADMMFDDLDAFDRTVGSNQYMIMTHDLKHDIVASGDYDGISHNYPIGSGFSARPQIIKRSSGKPIEQILKKIKALCLVNTSFNTHGTPILYSLDDCLRDFNKQRQLDVDNKMYLYVYSGE